MTDHNEDISSTGTDSKPWGIGVSTFCMLLHLSQFAGFILPGAGLVLPIVMWATNKDEHPEVNLHGLIVLNWIISATIYFFVCFLLAAVFIGLPLMILLTIVSLVFAVIGAVKANQGQYWPYPLSIDFFKVKSKLRAGEQKPV